MYRIIIINKQATHSVTNDKYAYSSIAQAIESAKKIADSDPNNKVCIITEDIIKVETTLTKVQHVESLKNLRDSNIQQIKQPNKEDLLELDEDTTAKKVAFVRRKTGAGIMDCKKVQVHQNHSQNAKNVKVLGLMKNSLKTYTTQYQ